MSNYNRVTCQQRVVFFFQTSFYAELATSQPDFVWQSISYSAKISLSSMQDEQIKLSPEVWRLSCIY